MLDHDEQRRLTEIEAQLRVEAPELHRLFATASSPNAGPSGRHPAHGHRPAPGRSGPPLDLGAPLEPVAAIVRSCAALAAAIALTALVTVVLGPDVGGLIGVLSLAVASMWAYQVLRGCPGLRSRRADDT
jgi:hypothetical protein